MKTTDNFADITIETGWQANKSCHRDIFNAHRINISRDILYEYEPELFMEHRRNDIVKPDPLLLQKYFKHKASDVVTVKKQNIKTLIGSGERISPKVGRFYPKGILGGVTNIFAANMHPFRCIGVDDNAIIADLNDPVSDKIANNDILMEISIDDIIEKKSDAGASYRCIMEEIYPGPGMQARFKDVPTDFFSSATFERSGSLSDKAFYQEPRFTAHTDSLCREHVRVLYNKLISPGSKVLDLMSSVYSHLPMDKELVVTGLGMNKPELDANKILSEAIIQDLNQNKVLPMDDNSFDVVVCSMSVEYLVDPFAIFGEVSRILRNNGLFIITFSNRWFPGKEIQIWNELHDFERMGLVSEYFFLTKDFTKVNTLSMRGFPRPYDPEDRYKDSLLFSDPLFAVWSQKR